MKKNGIQSKHFSRLVVDLTTMVIFAVIAVTGYYLHSLKANRPDSRCRNISSLSSQYPSLRPDISRMIKDGVIDEGKCDMLLVKVALLRSEQRAKEKGYFFQ